MAAIQRPLKGSRISSFYPVKTLPPLSSLDSAFQLQEYISLLIRLDVHDVEAIVSIPGKHSDGEKDKENGGDADLHEDDAKSEESDKEKEHGGDGKGEVTVDEACWIYEQLRRLAQDLSHPLITMLQQECTRATCPEMKAGEWLYLCVAHGNEGAMEQCCAIDYILHTLDSATALLNSPRVFPSRLSIPPISHRHFSSLARRLGRIFAHAYFHHRAAFLQAEAESALYARFLALTHRFGLVPAEFLVVPPRFASGISEDGDGERDGADDVQPPRLLAAAVDPQREREREREREQWLHVDKEEVPPGVTLGQTSQRGKSPGHESPRRVGRNRTDTMVFSEAASVVEELGRTEAESTEEVEMATAQNSSEPLAAAADLVPEVTQGADTAPAPEPSPMAEVDVADAAVELEYPTTSILASEVSTEPEPPELLVPSGSGTIFASDMQIHLEDTSGAVVDSTLELAPTLDSPSQELATSESEPPSANLPQDEVAQDTALEATAAEPASDEFDSQVGSTTEQDSEEIAKMLQEVSEEQLEENAEASTSAKDEVETEELSPAEPEAAPTEAPDITPPTAVGPREPSVSSSDEGREGESALEPDTEVEVEPATEVAAEPSAAAEEPSVPSSTSSDADTGGEES